MGKRAWSPKLVARETELALVAQALTAAAAGRPSVTLLAGEAGIGKTRIVRAVEALAERQAFVVLRGDCFESDSADLAYAPVAAAFRCVGRLTDEKVLAGLGNEAVSELARLVPGLGVAPPASGEHGGYAQTRLLEALLLLLRRLGESQPVALVLEDVHWADESTRTFLQFIARTVRDERLLVVATYRSEGVRHSLPLRRSIAELTRLERVETIELAPLAEGALAEQLESILGEPPPSRVAADIWTRSGGNPFFAEQLLAAWRTGTDDLPDGLRDGLLVRLDGLPATALAPLRALAVVGRVASADLVARVAALGLEDTRAVLRLGIDRDLLVIDRSGGGVVFRHALLREAVYASLLPDELESLHRAVATALMDSDDVPPAEIAHHAHAGGLGAVALRASLDAALAAERLYGYAEAGVHFDRALSRWRDDLAAELGLDRVDVLAHAAEAQRYGGDYERAIALCREAVATVDRAREPRRAAALLERLGQYHYADDEVPLACFDEALSLLPATPPSPERARVLAARGMALLGLSRYREARTACEASLAIAGDCGAHTEEGSARANLGLALAFLGDGVEADRQLDRALGLAETSGRPEDLARLQLYRAEVKRLRGDTAAALELMIEGTGLAERIGVAESFGRYMAVHVTEDLRALGRWAEARRRLKSLDPEALGGAARLLRAVVAARLATAAGDFAAAELELEVARGLAVDGVPSEALPGVHAAAAELALWSGRPDVAVAEVTAGLDAIGDRHDALNTPVLHALGARAYADVAEGARGLGDAGEAREARAGVDDMAARLDALVRLVAPGPPIATALRLLTHAERARAHDPCHHDAWDEVAAAWDALEQPYEAAYARWRLGEALLNAGDRRAAERALRHSVDAAVTLGAVPLLDELEALARRARLDLSAEPSPPLPETSAPDLGLTERELEVLSLLADGLTNRQIAERLFMAPSTAGVHVSRILAKLHARNRVEAAGIAHRHGLGAAGRSQTVPVVRL